MPDKYDAILIDFYGTIADGDRRQVEATCAAVVDDLGLPLSAPEFAHRWGRLFFSVVDASNHEAFKTLYECECISLLQTLSEFGVSCDPTPYVDQLKEYWQNPPLHDDALQALQQLEVPVCCVSNVDEEDLQCAMGRHGLTFDAVISSERARCYKPDGGIFRQALSALGVDARRCLHVGDSLHSDIGGAQAAGILAVWIERERRISDIGTSTADHTIKSLLDLHHILS